MPIIRCSNRKYRYGRSKCIFTSLKKAKAAVKAIHAQMKYRK